MVKVKKVGSADRIDRREEGRRGRAQQRAKKERRSKEKTFCDLSK